MKYCSQPFEIVNISKTNVSPCLCEGWHTTKKMGSLQHNNLIEIYNNESFKDFRQTIVDQSFKYCIKDQCPELWNLKDIDDFNSIELNPKLPNTLHLHIDATCNLKCASCRHSIYYNPEVNKVAETILNRLADSFKDHTETVTVYADGTGDIFASAAYRQFLTSDKIPKCFKFCITTNGNLITKNLDMLDNIKDQIDVVIVSFDAATDETYKEVRGGKFSLVLDGINELHKRNIKVCTQFVVQYKNYTEIVEYVNLCKRLQINHIGLQKLDRWPHMNNEWWNINQVDSNPNINYEQLLSDLLLAKQESNVGLCGGLQNLIEQLSN